MANGQLPSGEIAGNIPPVDPSSELVPGELVPGFVNALREAAADRQRNLRIMRVLAREDPDYVPRDPSDY